MSNPEDQPPAPGRTSKKGTKLLVVGGGVLAIAVIVLVVAVLPRGSRGEPSSAVDKPAATPEASFTPAASSPSAPASNPAATGVFTGEVMKQTQTVQQMDAMSLIEFAHLPYADRLASAIAKEPSIGVYTPDNDPVYSEPKYIPGGLWQDLEAHCLSGGNTTQGAKASSAALYYTIELTTQNLNDSYKAMSDSVIATGGQGVMNSVYPVFEDHGQWQSGVDRSGNPIDFIDITTHQADTSTLLPTTGSITDQVVRQQVQLLDGRTVVFYPRAYGIYGKKSPIDGGTY